MCNTSCVFNWLANTLCVYDQGIRCTYRFHETLQSLQLVFSSLMVTMEWFSCLLLNPHCSCHELDCPSLLLCVFLVTWALWAVAVLSFTFPLHAKYYPPMVNWWLNALLLCLCNSPLTYGGPSLTKTLIFKFQGNGRYTEL